MASSYPAGLDSFSITHADGTSEIIHAATVNDLADAVNKIEAELGTVPKGVYATVKARLAELETLAFNSQAGNYTLVLGDATGCVVMTSASANAVTVPPAASVAFPIGTEILIAQEGSGTTTITPGVGVTINNTYGSFVVAAQWGEVKLTKRATTNAWRLNGEVA